jgi:hypothetical protein
MMENDEGELRIAIVVIDDKVVIDFRKSIVWFALNKEEALKFVNAIADGIEELIKKEMH